MNASGIEGRNASAEAVADRAAADARLHGELAAIVHTGIEAGAFADPFDGKTWAAPWRAVLARTALRFRLAWRCRRSVARARLPRRPLGRGWRRWRSEPEGPSCSRYWSEARPGGAMPGRAILSLPRSCSLAAGAHGKLEGLLEGRRRGHQRATGADERARPRSGHAGGTASCAVVNVVCI